MPDDAFRMTSAVDGLSIQVYAWSPLREPKAAVLIAHGAAEHALRYERFASALVEAGFAVYAADHRGHGRSPGPDGLGDFGAGGWEALVADVGQLIEHVRQAHPIGKVLLFGHSMGSFAAQQCCFTHSAAIDALVLSGSSAWEAPPPGQPPPARVPPNAAFEPARTPYDWLSRDPAEVDKYIADPLCGFESQRPRRAGSRVDLRVLADPEMLRHIRADLPVLLVAGDEDPVNRQLEGLRLLERRWREAGVRHIDTRYYPSGRHEMLNEINRDEVTRDIVSWLEARCL
jgi:alpha-beta hydrolase superfamily lysophospholipase